MTDHPITPPPELLEEWLGLWPQDALLRAARWGADQELEECCDAIYCLEGQPLHSSKAEWLRAHRRPKPKSLAEEALQAITAIKNMADDYKQFDQDVDIICRALERLQELEGQGDG